MDVHWDAVGDKPMTKKDICDVRGFCLGLWDSFSLLRVSVGNDKYVLVI